MSPCLNQDPNAKMRQSVFSDVRMLHNSHKSTCSSRAVCSREASLRRGGATRQRQLCVSNLHKALRQQSTGRLTAPEDVVYECLTLLRRPDLESLSPFLPSGFDPAARTAHLRVGGAVVAESGPLACCHDFMDTAARRVLPGHLLRRCRVLSSMTLGPTCQQRVALTACTGEEAVFVWRLRRVAESSPGPAPAPAAAADSSADEQTHLAPGLVSMPTSSNSSHGASGRQAASIRTAGAGSGGLGNVVAAGGPVGRLPGSSGRWQGGAGSDGLGSDGSQGEDSGDEGAGPGGRGRGGAGGPVETDWVVERVSRDDSHDEDELPPAPHPRCSPELVVKAQLAALRRGDVVSAAGYNLWSRSTSGGWDLHLSAFRSLLRHPSYHVLLTADEAELGSSALLSPRKMVQEVMLRGHRPAGRLAAGGDDAATLVFQLGMQANGCWVVEAIRAN